MGRLICFIFLFFCGFISTAQDTTFVEPGKFISIQGSFTDFTVDNVGNIYLVINHQQLKKLNDQGDSIAVYNDVKRYGKIYSIDAGNPFKILVYYKEALTIVVLDRLLSVKNIIDLRKAGIQQAKAVTLSYDNNIWLYDELDAKIKKIDENGKTLSQSTDLRNVFEDAPAFETIIDDNRTLYLYDQRLGWFLFDYYGGFIKKHSFLNWQDVQVMNGTMLGRSANNLFSAKNNDLDYKVQPLPAITASSKKIAFSSKKMYVLNPGNLGIYDAP